MIDDYLSKLRDVDRRVRYLERLDVNPPAATVLSYTGTPTAGHYAAWSGAGTLIDSGFGTAQLPRYSGTPTAGNIASWSGAGTVIDGGIGTANIDTLSGTQTLTGLKTFSRQVTVSPTDTGDNAIDIRLPASSTGYHRVARDSGGGALLSEVGQLYSTSIGTSAVGTVFSAPFPANRAVIGDVWVTTAHRSAGNVQRHQVWQYSFAADVFGAAISGFTTSLLFSDNDSGQAATTVAISASGLNLIVVLTNNSTSKAITSVTTWAKFIATPNA